MHLAQQSVSVVRFGVFEADLSAGELRKNGSKIKIQDLPFRALKLLLSHPNEVLSREQFRNALWPENVFVDFDRGISSTVNRLRDALGDSADNPIFIQTVERRGYRWIAPIHPPVPPLASGPVLVISEKKDERRANTSPTIRFQSTWALALPLLVLALGLWGFRATSRPVTAAVTKPSGTTVQSNQRPASSEAEEFYLKGRFYWQKRNKEALTQSVDYFTQSIIRDPNYAPAYVGLADAYNLMREYSLMPAAEAYPRAIAAAKKAVELDPKSSEAHASLAFALYYGMWDAATADQEFRRAIELSQENAVAHHWYATYLCTVGRARESLAEIDRAQALDPTSRAIIADKGLLLQAAGHRSEGIALLKQLEASDPDFISPHRYLKSDYFADGDYKAYLTEWKKEASLLEDKDIVRMIARAERGLATAGRAGMLQSLDASERRLVATGKISPFLLAETDSYLGNNQDALRYLQMAYDEHDEVLVGMPTDPAFTSLHQDPAYQDLVAKLQSASPH